MDEYEGTAGRGVWYEAPALACGTVVALVPDLLGVQAADGTMVPAERLGVGLVQALDPHGDVYVHWVRADLDTWVAAEDVRSLGAGQHIVTVRRHNHPGRQNHAQYFLATLEHHWTVELLPGSVIRAVRADGLSWTFLFNTLTHEVDPPWLEPLDDDAAEAVVAADLALAQLDTLKGILLAFVHRASALVPRRRTPAIYAGTSDWEEESGAQQTL